MLRRPSDDPQFNGLTVNRDSFQVKPKYANKDEETALSSTGKRSRESIVDNYDLIRSSSSLVHAKLNIAVISHIEHSHPFRAVNQKRSMGYRKTISVLLKITRVLRAYITSKMRLPVIPRLALTNGRVMQAFIRARSLSFLWTESNWSS